MSTQQGKLSNLQIFLEQYLDIVSSKKEFEIKEQDLDLQVIGDKEVKDNNITYTFCNQSEDSSFKGEKDEILKFKIIQIKHEFPKDSHDINIFIELKQQGKQNNGSNNNIFLELFKENDKKYEKQFEKYKSEILKLKKLNIAKTPTKTIIFPLDYSNVHINEEQIKIQQTVEQFEKANRDLEQIIRKSSLDKSSLKSSPNEKLSELQKATNISQIQQTTKKDIASIIFQQQQNNNNNSNVNSKEPIKDHKYFSNLISQQAKAFFNHKQKQEQLKEQQQQKLQQQSVQQQEQKEEQKNIGKNEQGKKSKRKPSSANKKRKISDIQQEEQKVQQQDTQNKENQSNFGRKIDAKVLNKKLQRLKNFLPKQDFILDYMKKIPSDQLNQISEDLSFNMISSFLPSQQNCTMKKQYSQNIIQTIQTLYQ